ncbi:hypothetical protein BGZ63DRAFT_458066 [Mariannaea sp. PMI_226]|nr:hypothetical protein BGZ63DRAFT_458066 [Mariannaea sp. PMI_226]
MSAPYTLYITLQYLRNVEGENKYHWGLWATEGKPPAGYLFHATDTGRQALDLFYEARKVSNPTKSKSMVVCLKIANAPRVETLHHFASQVPLMNPRHLPKREPQWTCRVWVKETLKVLHENHQIELPADVDTIERYCKSTADSYIRFMGTPKVFSDIKWLPTSSEPDLRNEHQRYYGPSAMETETYQQAYYGSSPMVTESHSKRYYGSSPMVTESHSKRHYGSSPMVTESHRKPYYSSSRMVAESHPKRYY